MSYDGHVISNCISRRQCREYTELYVRNLLAGKSVSADLKSKLEVQYMYMYMYFRVLVQIHCTLIL